MPAHLRAGIFIVFENPWLCQGFRKSFSDEKKTPLAESAATNSTAKQKENIQKECYQQYIIKEVEFVNRIINK